MSVATMDERIGAPSHWRRNLWLFLAAIAATAVIGGYYAATLRTDANEMSRLDQFRATVAESCEAPEFAQPAPPVLKDLYLSSAKLREAVDRQQAALEAGASCESVYKALRAADYPMPAMTQPRPTIHLQTSQNEAE